MEEQRDIIASWYKHSMHFSDFDTNENTPYQNLEDHYLLYTTLKPCLNGKEWLLNTSNTAGHPL
jgi:hypothetical protein